ncbi:ATP-dependent zinc metalloprotease FtsH [bacterium BMS3Abin04]|nr:ATP-dependent zinc metalloprotease FtsH [bacterium BMS3Abin04]
MSQSEHIKDLVRYGLEKDVDKFKEALNELIEHAKKTKRINYALQLQSLLRDTMRNEQNKTPKLVGSKSYFAGIENRELNDFILEKITSEYSFQNIVINDKTKNQLEFLVKEHTARKILEKYQLPISNKILFYGPSGCGKTLASYVLAGELKKLMFVINLGAIVSSKLGETSKNLAKIFRQASVEDSIIFIDEFDSLGKIRNYDQDHGEMKRIVNTILQLFDYLPQSSIVIAATNQIDMIDDALLRRFDLKVKLDLPNKKQIKALIELVLKNGNFEFDKKTLTSIIKNADGLSYYSIQKSLITTIKKTILENNIINPDRIVISSAIFNSLLLEEKKQIENN